MKGRILILEVSHVTLEDTSEFGPLDRTNDKMRHTSSHTDAYILLKAKIYPAYAANIVRYTVLYFTNVD